MSYQSLCQGDHHWLPQTSLCSLNYVIFNDPQEQETDIICPCPQFHLQQHCTHVPYSPLE